MKRLPFALIALSLSIPVVACLNNAGDEDVASGENDLSQGARDACNFGFAEVDKAVKNSATDDAAAQLKMTSVVGLTPGQKLLWGDFNGDGNKDFAQVQGAETIQVYKGDGKGAFVKSKTAKKLPNIADRKRSAIAIVASGDFDGDGKTDLVALATSKAKDAPADDDSTQRGDVTILYGADGDNSLEAPKTIPSLADPITDWTYYHEAGDLDGDGKDDLVITTKKGEIVAFGNADRTLKAVPSGFDSTHARSLAFISPKTADKAASLVIATPNEIASITFDATPEHKSTVKKMAYEFPANTSLWTGTDLDQNGANEISILGAQGLSVIPVTAEQKGATTFEGVPGVLVGSADFDGNKSSEILFKVNDDKLFAACGAGERANQIVAAPLKVAYGKNLIVAGQLDLNKDGKADLVTLDISSDASRGTVKVYLASGKEDPAPELQTFAAPGGTSSADAGTDSTVSTGTDSSAEASTTGGDAAVKDASAPKDASTTSDATAPKDASAPKDAGKDSSTTVKKDAGSKPDNAGDDDDDNETGDDDDDDAPGDGEGTGTKNDGPSKRPTTKPSNGATTGSSNVSIIPKPTATDDGCSTAPGSHGLSSSAFGGLFAAMMLLVRRRRNNKA